MSQVPVPLSPFQLERVASVFKALGEPTRLRILQSICHGPRSVSDIVDLTEATQANVSKHLALLVRAGVLERRRDGQRVFYGMRDALVPRLCDLVCATISGPA